MVTLHASSTPARIERVFQFLDSTLTDSDRAALRSVTRVSETDSMYQFLLTLKVGSNTWPPSLQTSDSLSAALREWHVGHSEDLAGFVLDAYVQHLTVGNVDLQEVLRRLPAAPKPAEFRKLQGGIRAPAR